jgi:hypothetical protein
LPLFTESAPCGSHAFRPRASPSNAPFEAPLERPGKNQKRRQAVAIQPTHLLSAVRPYIGLPARLAASVVMRACRIPADTADFRPSSFAVFMTTAS